MKKEKAGRRGGLAGMCACGGRSKQAAPISGASVMPVERVAAGANGASPPGSTPAPTQRDEAQSAAGSTETGAAGLTTGKQAWPGGTVQPSADVRAVSLRQSSVLCVRPVQGRGQGTDARGSGVPPPVTGNAMTVAAPQPAATNTPGADTRAQKSAAAVATLGHDSNEFATGCPSGADAVRGDKQTSTACTTTSDGALPATGKQVRHHLLTLRSSVLIRSTAVFVPGRRLNSRH